jgi:hypothetical protein
LLLVTFASTALLPAQSGPKSTPRHGSTPAAYQSLMDLVPYRGIGEPEDVARAAGWLASDDSNYVVGATLFVDGGMTPPALRQQKCYPKGSLPQLRCYRHRMLVTPPCVTRSGLLSPVAGRTAAKREKDRKRRLVTSSMRHSVTELHEATRGMTLYRGFATGG